jgi:hypothetical protein
MNAVSAKFPAFFVTAALALAACGGSSSYVRGTKVEDSAENREIIQVCEDYRKAVERLDVDHLMVLASEKYYEDGGTPDTADDYGYQGLQQVLQTRFRAAKAIRYAMEYRKIARRGNRATVEIYIDASFEFTSARGDIWHPVSNYNRLELEYDQKRGKWLFLAGM